MHKLFGAILIEQGVLDEEQLKKTLQLQKRSNVRLGQILLKKGIISEEDIVNALSIQFGFDKADRLEAKNIEAIKPRVPLKFVQKYRMVPFHVEKKTVKVALTDPTAVHPLDELRLMCMGYQVEPVLAAESEILRIIHNHYEPRTEENERTGLDLEEGLEFLDEIDDMADSIDLANEAPIIKMVNVILSNAVSERASDIHIEPQEKELVVRYRVDGILHRVMSPPRSIQNGIISRIKIMGNMNIAENRLPQDGRIKIRFGGKDIDIRVSSLPTHFGERLVMRLLDKSTQEFELEKIGFDPNTHDAFKKLLDEPNGIVLVTGPTGSGKTTTLYAALNYLNEESRNIITVEDPVEYQVSGVSQVQARPKIGLSFAEGLRSILRQDPDIVMVGEIRDEETARVAVQASLTGHLVFSTLHTNDAVSAVTRLLDMGIEPYLVTSTCRGFMAQRLLRRLCNECKKKTEIDLSKMKEIGYNGDPGRKKKLTIYEPAGCKKCMNTGYHGRVGIYELFILDNETRNLVIQSAGVEEIRQVALKKGMQTLRMAALNKVEQGTTSLEEALRVT